MFKLSLQYWVSARKVKFSIILVILTCYWALYKYTSHQNDLKAVSTQDRKMCSPSSQPLQFARGCEWHVKQKARAGWGVLPPPSVNQSQKRFLTAASSLISGSLFLDLFSPTSSVPIAMTFCDMFLLVVILGSYPFPEVLLQLELMYESVSTSPCLKKYPKHMFPQEGES